MSKIKNEYSCSLILANDLVGGKWKLRILWHIIRGDNRFSSLKKTIPEITEKMLTTQLRELVESGLVERNLISEKPLSVDYNLSEKYNELKGIVESLCNFSIAYGNINGIILNDK